MKQLQRKDMQGQSHSTQDYFGSKPMKASLTREAPTKVHHYFRMARLELTHPVPVTN